MNHNILDVTFPLSGTLADISVALESIIIFISIQWFFQFFINFIRSEKKDKQFTTRKLSWSIIILGLGCTYFIFLIGDFVLDPISRIRFNQFGYLTLATGAMVFFIINEQLDHVKFRILSILSITIEIIIIICIILNYKNTVFIAASIGIPLIILHLIFYAKRLLKLSNKNRELVKSISITILGFSITVLGYVSMADSIVIAFGISIRIVGDICVIIGICICQISMRNLPDLSEYDWLKALKTIIVIDKSGISLFSRFYNTPQDETKKEYLISGALNSINLILSQMTGNEQLNTIELPDKCIMIEYMNNLKFVIIADKFLLSLQVRLRQFADEFYSIFKNYIENFSGNLDIFLPAESMVDRIFKPT